MTLTKEGHKRLIAAGRLGGKAVAEKRTEQERADAARVAARARWGNAPKCACGKMTVTRAEEKGHKCQTPTNVLPA